MSSQFNKKIKSAMESVIPPLQDYTVYSSPTGFDDMEVLRVITTAWRSLGKAERITKVQDAVMPVLDAAEQRRIFRFSVLTPKEWMEMRERFVGEKMKRLAFRRKRAVMTN